ncbi:MAG TPA: sigma-70 family RNA polymerase sigma factor [Candidatus Saccharimonadales bacterium]|nr:sigma-70 family RNA polymerase sigma factor [Candidatus Saccharimonadales bacterium]
MTSLSRHWRPFELSALAAVSRENPPLPAMTESNTPVPSASVTPEELARRCQRGCQNSFAELVHLYQDRIFRYLWHLTGNAHDAEDIAQDTFLKAYQAMGRFDGSGSFTSWLFVIAKRTALNHLRHTRREVASEAVHEVDQASPAVLLEQTDEQQSIWSVARRLNKNQYEALWLRYGEGLTVSETARVMDMGQIRVRVLIHRARGQLAELLKSAGMLREQGNRRGARN